MSDIHDPSYDPQDEYEFKQLKLARHRWRGELSVTRRQYSLWIGHIFIGEVVFDRAYRDEKPWRVELSTQKYLKTMGRYKTEIEAHDALLDAAVDALLSKTKE